MTLNAFGAWIMGESVDLMIDDVTVVVCIKEQGCTVSCVMCNLGLDFPLCRAFCDLSHHIVYPREEEHSC